MKISLNWMNELFPELEKGLQGFSDEIKRRLPLSGLEIGSVKKLSEGISDVVVAQIVEFAKHPQADKLNVCQVDCGDGKRLQIVCGAPNVKAKMKVALARIGCVLPGDFKIKQAQIRGLDSFGMLCSQKELGLSSESEGILELPESAPVGASLINALGLNDEVWEVELTPDRADCLSHWGIAREISRIVGKKPKLPELDVVSAKESSDVPLITVENQIPKLCPLYTAQVFDGLSNGQSPDWLKRKLESIGLRPKDVVVDISNFVLMELGHPVHFFDADKVRGSKIIVRMAKAGEKLKTLDQVERTLSAQDIVIADLEGPVALAGVMGGLDSAVTTATTRVVLECAVFDPEQIRSMAQRHKIHTDSSHRFERGVDVGIRYQVIGRILFLLRTLAKGRKRGSLVEIKGDKFEKLTVTHSHNFDLRAFKDVCGVEATTDELVKAFNSVGLDSVVKSPNVVKVEVPTFRHDLNREIDLIEEAARLLGFDRVPVRYPVQTEFTKSGTRSLYHRLRQIRHRILDCGLSEMMPYNFISLKESESIKDAKLVEIKNPLSADWTYMRPNISLGLITVLTRHAALGQLGCAVFDQGNVFSSGVLGAEKSIEKADKVEKADRVEKSGEPGPLQSKLTGVRESYHVGLAMMGPRHTLHWSSDKKSPDSKAHVDFFDAKGVLERTIEGLTAIDARWSGTQFVALSEFLENPKLREEIKIQAPWIPVDLLHPYRSALLIWPGKPPGMIKGFVGEINPLQKSDLLNLPKGLQLGAVLGEICVIDDLAAEMQKSYAAQLGAQSPRGKMKTSKRLPLVERDLALVVAPHVKSAELSKAMARAVGQELLDLSCVDLFKLPDGNVSLAFRAQIQGLETTLTDAEINDVVKKMLAAAKDKFGAELRG